MNFKTIDWKDGKVVMLDQRALPNEEIYLHLGDVAGVAAAIKDMAIRGAPAIGVAGALGLALASRSWPDDPQGFEAGRDRDAALLAGTRPTARNLFWALDRMTSLAKGMAHRPTDEIRRALLEEALSIRDEDLRACRAMGDHGADLVPNPARILTHCNAGGLATAGYGTALGVIRSAVAQGKKVKVYADETRPYLQGSRLTAWELGRDGIDVTVIADNMAGYLMALGHVDLVIVGADRIARNGDVANKIGTYSLAVLASHHRLPFHVAAPLSTFDLSLDNGTQIPIEQRPAAEITHLGQTRLVPPGMDVWHPAFDITPAALVTTIITEKGILKPPFVESIHEVAKNLP